MNTNQISLGGEQIGVDTNLIQEIKDFAGYIQTLVQTLVKGHQKGVEIVSNMFSYITIEGGNLEEKIGKIKEKLEVIKEEMRKNGIKNITGEEFIALGKELIIIGIYNKENYLDKYLEDIEKRKITPLEETWIGVELEVNQPEKRIIEIMLGDLEEVIKSIDLYFMSKQNSFFHIAYKLEKLGYDIRDYYDCINPNNPFRGEESPKILEDRSKWNIIVDETNES